MEPTIAYKLEIIRSDLSTYWVEHFKDIQMLNKWLAEEQTRPYWGTDYTAAIYELDSKGMPTLINSFAAPRIALPVKSEVL
jgi:hypothetical protein